MWDPSNEQETRLAQRSALNKLVVGIIVGNEGLMFRRYSPNTLWKAMDYLRRSTAYTSQGPTRLHCRKKEHA